MSQRKVVTIFSLGLVLGGIVSAVPIWMLGFLFDWISPTWKSWALLAFGSAAILRDTHVVRFPLPENHRQVPKEALNKDILRGVLQFGFEMGTGVRTFLSSTAPYVLVFAMILLVDNLWLSLLIGACFGVGRAIVPFARYYNGAGETWDQLMERHIRWIAPLGTAVCSAWASLTSLGPFD